MAMLREQFEHEQISLFLGPNYVVTFQQYAGDCLESLRERLRHRAGLFRTAGPDYLAHAILDAIVDSYFPVLEEYGEKLEALEEEILERPQRSTILRVQATKRGILTMRRSIWPQREFFNSLLRDGSPLITEQTRLHLRDAYDHTMRIMDLVDTYREISGGLTELYMSSVSHRMNDVMKVLTVIATIFIPLTFIAGIYGMNFNRDASPWNMPELDWYWAYPACWMVMAAMTVVMLVFFRRRGWIGTSDRPDR
jgi:magnesium transporter